MPLWITSHARCKTATASFNPEGEPHGLMIRKRSEIRGVVFSGVVPVEDILYQLSRPEAAAKFLPGEDRDLLNAPWGCLAADEERVFGMMFLQ